MYLAAANAVARARTTRLLARTWRQLPSSFDVARRVQLQLQRNATSLASANARSAPQNLKKVEPSAISVLTTEIIAAAKKDVEEAIRLHERAWARSTPPLNAAAQTIIRALVYPEPGGPFAGVDSILRAVSILKRHIQKPLLKKENERTLSISQSLLLTAIVGNPTIPDRTRLVNDILSDFRERGWPLERGAERVSSLLPSIYRAPSHAAAVDLVLDQKGLSVHDFLRLATHIAGIKYDADSFLSRADLLRLAAGAPPDMNQLALFKYYIEALHAAYFPEHPLPQLLETVRDVERDVVARFGTEGTARDEKLNLGLLKLYGRLARSGDVLPDLERCWRRIPAPKKRLSTETLCLAYRAFPRSHLRKLVAQRANSDNELAIHIWNKWVQALCRMGDVDEAFAVFKEHLGDRHPSLAAGGVLFASARSEKELERWAELFPTTWNSSQYLIRTLKPQPAAS